MNILIRSLTCVAAFAALAPALAQEEETADGAVETESEAAKSGSHISAADDRLFTVLPFCKLLEGRAEVLSPGQTEWIPVEEGRFFPLGSRFRTVSSASRFELAFGREASVVVSGVASFGTRQQGLEVDSRTVVLESGVIELRLPLNFPEKMFSVTSPGFCVENPAGVSRYSFRKTGDGDAVVVRCVSGVLSIKGRHFAIPAMHAANEVEIRTSQDFLFTGLFGKRGDYMCHLDAGIVKETDWEQQQEVVVAKSIDWRLSPQTAVRIHRLAPAIGKNLAVDVSTYDSYGQIQNHVTFTEGRHEVNTGDQGPATQQDRARAAKALEEAAAAASDTATTEETSEE